MKKINFFICFLFTLVYSLSATNVTCSYKNSQFWAAKYMYNCYVTNMLDIVKPEDAEITAVSGTHLFSESDNSEVVFYTHNKNVAFFPLGLEKIYKNLNGIILYTEPISFIQQSDLKAYTKLIFLQLAETKIEVLEDGLFDFNPKLKYLALNENKIFHIGLKVFDGLGNLESLYLDKNICIDKKSENSKSRLVDLIQIVKDKCMSTEFFGLDEKFMKLEEEMESLNYKNYEHFEKKVEQLEGKFLRSKFANFALLKEKLEKLKEVTVVKDAKADERTSGAKVVKVGLVLMILCSFGAFL